MREKEKNTLKDSSITASGDVHLGDNNTTIIYGDRQVPRYLTGRPFNSNYFIGRDGDLAAIEESYQKDRGLLVLVNGEGGMGKTTLAAKYWFRHEERYQHLAWMFADSGIGDALVSLAPAIGLQFAPTDDQKTQVQRVVAAVNNLKKPCLLIFDNANKAEDLERFLVALGQLNDCHILITSRVTAIENVAVHRVTPLAESDAVKLFKKHYPKYAEKDAPLLHNLLEAVGYNTLVIELLAKNLAVFNKFKKQYTLASLVNDLQEEGLLAVQGKAVATVYQAEALRKETPESIITAMYDVAGLSATELHVLTNLAVLPAENIPYERLMALMKPEPAEAYDDALVALQQKGWIEYFEQTAAFKVSPVIQQVVLHRNRGQLEEICETLITSLNNGLKRDVLHVDNYSHAGILAHYAESVVVAMQETFFNLAVLCERIGNFYSELGNLDKALEYFDNDSSLTKALHEEFPSNLEFKYGLAISYFKLGKIQQSLGNLDKALEYYKNDIRLTKSLHEDFPSNVKFKNGLAISYSKLGEIQQSLGDLDKALWYFENYNLLEKSLHEDFPTNVEFKNNLAISYSRLGDLQKTLGNLDKALGYFENYNLLKKSLHEDFPSDLGFKNGLAISYSRLGDLQKTLGDLDKALWYFENYNLLEKSLHEDFPSNVEFKNGLAISYFKLGEIQQSLGNFDKALDFYENDIRLTKSLHEDFPSNVEFKNNLAISYLKLGSMYENKVKDQTVALNHYQASETLLLELTTSFPQYSAFLENLEWVQNRLDQLR